MKKVFALAVCLVLCHLAMAQVIRFRDQESGQPLELVSLISSDPRVLEYTNNNGEVDLKPFMGSGRIEVRLLGYDTQITSYALLSIAKESINMVRSNIGLQQVVISATRWAQPNRESPQKVTSIKAKDVAIFNPATTADLLGNSGEVFIQKSQLGGGSPMIRGFATNRLLYSVDGIRMNTAIFRGGNIQNVISLDPFAVERTEVLFGPGSVLYGSDAIGAVMNFQTLSPQFSLNDAVLASGAATARYASASTEKTIHFHANIGWKKWALVSSFSSFDFGDLRMGANGRDSYLRPWYASRIDSTDVTIPNDDPELQVGTGYQQQNFMQKVAFKPNDHLKFTYAFHYSATGNVPRYDRLIESTGDGLPRSAEWYFGPQIWRMNHLEVLYQKSNILFDEAKLQLAQQYFEESRNDRRYGRDGLRQQTEQVDAYSVNLDFAKYFNQKSRLFYGAEYVLNQVESSGMTTDISTGASSITAQRYPQADWSSVGVYAMYQRDLLSNLVLQAGARYNGYGIDADFSQNQDFIPLPESNVENNNGALTGSIGLNYRPSETWWLSANVSTAFRAPNVDDLGKTFESIEGSLTVPNPDLDPEYAYNGELTVSKIISDRFKIDLTGYYTLLTDALVRRPYALNGSGDIIFNGDTLALLAIQNAAEAHVFGIQAGFEYKIGAGFTFSGRYNFQQGEEELDNGDTSPSRHAAPMFGRLQLGYSRGKISLIAYTDFSGEVAHEDLAFEEQDKQFIYAQNQNGETFSPNWYTLNLKANVLINENFSCSAGIENIADERYRPYSSGIVASGRNIVASLTAKF